MTKKKYSINLLQFKYKQSSELYLWTVKLNLFDHKITCLSSQNSYNDHINIYNMIKQI